jgi:flagellar L-ring protein precursor FlgH
VNTKRSRLHLLAAVAATLAACAAAWAGSNYRKVKGGGRPLTSDHTARRVGDLVTIVVNERSIVENESERESKKTTSRTAKMGGTLDLANIFFPVGKHIFDFPKLDFSSSSAASHKGEADFGQDRSLIDEISVTVQDVQPNGNLVVIGQRTRTVNGDTQIIAVSGIVRPIDLDFDNKVKSTRVAQFHIVTQMKGPEKNFTDPGWFSQFANFFNPF